jgi:hypothetical protein
MKTKQMTSLLYSIAKLIRFVLMMAAFGGFIPHNIVGLFQRCRIANQVFYSWQNINDHKLKNAIRKT